MIKVNDEVIRVEHFPDGTQKLSIESIWNASGSYGIDWRYIFLMQGFKKIEKDSAGLVLYFLKR